MLTMLAAMAAAIAPAPQEAPIQVTVLSAYNFGNPGRDKVNVHVDDVTTPHRQHELEALAESIATFKPTRFMVVDAAVGTPSKKANARACASKSISCVSRG